MGRDDRFSKPAAAGLVKRRTRMRRPLCAAVLSVTAFLLAPAFSARGPLTAISWATPARAADPSPSFTATLATESARPGEHVVLEVGAKLPSGYHMYAMTKISGGPKPLSIAVDDPRLSPVTPWYAGAPMVVFDSRFGKAVEQFADEVVHRRGFVVPAGTAPGSAPLLVAVNGQICNERQCLIFRETLSVVLTVFAGPPRAASAAAPTLEGTAFGPDRPEPVVAGGHQLDHQGNAPAGSEPGAPPLGKGMWSFLLLAFLAGIGALSTPCVFPMIPITVSFFSKYAKVSVRQSAGMAAIYAASIIFCFTIIGVAVSVLFGAVGMQSLSSSPGFNIFLFLVLAGFSFNLFGLFEINVPSGLIARASAKERELTSDSRSFGSQAVGVFLMAVTFTLVSFTCTVGFVGVVLAQAAKGHWFYPAIGMLVFSAAFSIPFFCLAMFPSWANKLRGKSGDWMVATKVMLGFFELAGAFKFLSNVDLLWHWGMITRPLVLALWGGIFFAAALYLLRVFNLPSPSPSPSGDGKTRNVGPVRMVLAIFMFAFALYSATGVRDMKSMGGWLDGWLPPAVYPGDETSAMGAASGGATDDFAWIKDDLPKASATGRELGRAVFVDFTGYTCTNCRYMEFSLFPRPEIRARLKQMVLAQAFTDCDEPVCGRQRAEQVKRFDTAALPFYAIIDPTDGTTLATFASSTNDATEFARFLQLGLDGYASAARVAVRGTAAPTSPAGVPGLDFSFAHLDGGAPFRLSQLRGQWTLVNFWASWCGPCLKELKEEFPAVLAQSPWVKLVTVTFEGPDTRPDALAFARSNQLLTRSIALFGPESVTAANLDARFSPDDALPATYLIGPQGQLAWTRHGSVDRNALSEALAQSRPPR